MAKSIDQQIKDAMAKKVVGRTTEIYKAVVLELYLRITANSLQVGIAYGSPVLTGRYYASHTIARGGVPGIPLCLWGMARLPAARYSIRSCAIWGSRSARMCPRAATAGG